MSDAFGLFERANDHAGQCWRWMEALAKELRRQHPEEHPPEECHTCALLEIWDGDEYGRCVEPPEPRS